MTTSVKPSQDPNLVPLERALREVTERAIDADWSGDAARAKTLFQQAERIRVRIENGELYEVLF